MKPYLGLLFKGLLSYCIFASSATVMANGVSPTVLILPKGPGSIGGVGENVQANLNMGLMSYSIPLQMPAGRNGHTPTLRVAYSSSGGSSEMGIGWRLHGIKSIERLTVRGLPRYGKIQDPALKGEDRFYASEGEIVKIPNTNFYRLRYEGQFIRFRWHHTGDQQGYWTAEYPNGSIGFFGASYTTNTQRNVDVKQATVDRESHLYGPLGTFRWHLRSLVDPNGNRIEYKYFRHKNNTYLSSVEWVFSKTNTPLYKAVVQYEDRQDPIFDGKPGFDRTIAKRVKQLQIMSTGQPFRSYTFAYDPNSRLSRLHKVMQYGTDGKTAFPVHFSMKYSSADYAPAQAMMKKIQQSLAQNFTNQNSDLIDMNGDGLPDVIDTSRPKHQFHFNTMTVKELKQDRHDFSKPRENPDNTSAKLSSDQVQMLDFNGDGFTDLVDASNKKIYINKGKGKWEDQSAELLGQFPNPSSQNPNRRFFDYNGDKSIDVIEINGNDVRYWVSNGKGQWISVTGKQSLGADFAKDKLRLIDMNGDGLFDAVQIFGGRLRYRKYYGYGRWSDWIQVKIEGLTQSLSDKARFRDINGDGLADMVAFVANSIKFFVNLNGTEFSAGKDLNARFKGIEIPNSDPSKVTIRIADINGNGSRDIVWLDSSGRISYLELFKQRPNLLTEISNNIGKKIQVSYGSSVHHYLRDKAAGKEWPSKLPMPFIVVNQIKTWAMFDTTQPNKGCPEIQRIAYHDGYYEGKEKKFRGFRRVESTIVGDQGTDCPTSLGARTKMLYFYIGDGDTSTGDKDNYFHGKLRESATTGLDTKGKQITFHTNKQEWSDCPLTAVTKQLDPPVRYICLKANEKTIREGLEQKRWKTLRTEYEYDGYGNINLVKRLGDKDKQGDEIFVKTTYTAPKDPLSPAPSSRWFLRLLTRKAICDKASGPCATQLYFYDGDAYKGLPEGQITRGNLSRASAAPSEGAPLIHLKRYEYDAYGNTIGLKTANGHLRKVEWDSEFQRFPSKETIVLKALSLTASTRWDVRFGTVSQSTNWNGHITLYTYDTFGRLLSKANPGATADKPSEVYEYKLRAPLSSITGLKRSKRDGKLDLKTILCFDGMGRRLQQRTETKPGSFLITQHKVFNSAGLPARLYNPYNSTRETCSFTPEGTPAYTDTKYDPLRRMIKKIQQDKSASRYVYEPLTRLSYDEEDNDPTSPHANTPDTHRYDGLGRIIEQIKYTTPGNAVSMRFTWSALNIYGKDLMRINTDQQGNQKIQTYDYLARVLKVTDPDRKNIKYTYDANGNMTKRTDARGISTRYTYDELDRTLSIMQEGKEATKIQFFYDRAFGSFSKATNLKAQLAGIKHPMGREEYGYDKRSNLSHYRKQIMGVSFDFTNEYDHVDRLISRTYPDGRTLQFKYDGASRRTSVPGMIKQLTYGPSGYTKGWVLHNGTTTNVQLDQRFFLRSMRVNDGKILDYKYNYDKNGNILSIDKGIQGDTEQHTYRYDAMYRLTNADLGKEILKYTYDKIGNILSKVSSLKTKSPAHIGTYLYDKLRPRAVIKAGTMQTKYDLSGHVLSHQNIKYEWDFLGRRTSASTSGKDADRYWYGAGTMRQIKREQGLHTLYINGNFEIRDGAAVIYTRVGKGRVAAWKSHKMTAKIYDDLAQQDGKITAADAWLYARAKTNSPDKLIKRPINADLTGDMLQASLSRMMSDGKDEKVYFHNDHLTSTVAVTDQSGRTIATRRYYPYGNVRKRQGHLFSFGYMGTERDHTTKDNYAQHRYLDTKLARWKSADPAFEQFQNTNDEFNSYWYVKNNPIRYTDTTGTLTQAEFIVQGSIAGGATIALGLLTAMLEYRKAKQQNKGHGRTIALGALKVVLSVAAAAVSIAGVATDDDGARWAGFGLTLLSSAVSIYSIARDHNKQSGRTQKAQTERERHRAYRASHRQLGRSASASTFSHRSPSARSSATASTSLGSSRSIGASSARSRATSSSSLRSRRAPRAAARRRSTGSLKR